jgi:hypothetical protein
MRNFPGLLLTLLLLTAAAGVRAADAAPAGAPAEVTALLREFLVRVDEPAMHDRFWAADLIYTAASGKVQTKADIMRGFAQAPTDAAKPRPPATTYGAEDVVVRVYGDTAALTFRLVAQTPDGRTGHYRNSGTFVRRDGKWQVVTWQATPVPPAENKPAP